MTVEFSADCTASPLAEDLLVIAAGNANMDIVAQISTLPLDDEKVHIEALEEYPGGSASNYAVAMSRLGGKTGFVGFVGDDDVGHRLITAFQDEHVDITHLKIAPLRTGFAFVATTCDGHHFTLGYLGANTLLNPLEFPLDYLRQAKLLHMSSIDYKVLSEGVETAKKARIPLSLDPGQTALALGLNKLKPLLRSATLLFLNQIEFETLTNKSPDPNNIRSLARELSTIISVQRGDQGVYVCAGDQLEAVPAFSVKVADTTGAGDTYAASFTMALLKGFDLKEAATYGCAAAALKCLKRGARPGMPSHTQVIQYLAQQHIPLRKSVLMNKPPQVNWMRRP